MTKEEIRNKVIEILLDNSFDNSIGYNLNKYIMEDYNMDKIDYIIMTNDIDDYFNIDTTEFIVNKNGNSIDHTISEIIDFIDKQIN